MEHDEARNVVDPREPVDLRSTISFAPLDALATGSLNDFPWPETDHTLLSPPRANEIPIPAEDRTTLDTAERFRVYAQRYHALAQTLIQTWLVQQQHDVLDFVNVVSFMYRHAIELYLKYAIASDPSFLDETGTLIGHDLTTLWQRLSPLISSYYEPSEILLMSNLVGELQALAPSADSFRYPFRDVTAHRRVPATRFELASELEGGSADYLFLGLERIVNFLRTVETARELTNGWEAEMRLEAGYGSAHDFA